MNISCDKCQSKFKIPDDKIPEGKTVNIKCPKCKNKLSVSSKKTKVKEEKPKENMFDFEEAGDSSFEDYDVSDKPFDFIEEEGKTALLCENNPQVKEQIVRDLNIIEYSITESKSMREALRSMRYHSYDFVAVNETFDTKDPEANGVLIYLQRLNMAIRRNIFVVLISDRFKTMDSMMAFNKSVNVIINTKDIENFDKVIKRGLAEHDLFYRIFNESLKAMGQI